MSTQTRTSSFTSVFTGSLALQDESTVLEDYIIGQRLGEGAYGSVYVAKYIPSGESFALKILQKEDLLPPAYSGSAVLDESTSPNTLMPLVAHSERGASPLRAAPSSSPFGEGHLTMRLAHSLEKHIIQEATVMQALEHPHVVKYYKFLNSTVAFYFIMELAEGGELFDLIISKQYFSEEESRMYFQQLISAIDYCHSNGVAHKDLKAENLLLSGDNRLLVCDFGFSTKNAIHNLDDPEETITTGDNVALLQNLHHGAMFGTLHYMSPEAVLASTQNDFSHQFDAYCSPIAVSATMPSAPASTSAVVDFTRADLVAANTSPLFTMHSFPDSAKAVLGDKTDDEEGEANTNTNTNTNTNLHGGGTSSNSIGSNKEAATLASIEEQENLAATLFAAQGKGSSSAKQAPLTMHKLPERGMRNSSSANALDALVKESNKLHQAGSKGKAAAAAGSTSGHAKGKEGGGGFTAMVKSLISGHSNTSGDNSTSSSHGTTRAAAAATGGMTRSSSSGHLPQPSTGADAAALANSSKGKNGKVENGTHNKKTAVAVTAAAHEGTSESIDERRSSNAISHTQTTNTAATSITVPSTSVKTKHVIVDPFQQDLWSAGVILFFMLTGRLPFDGRDEEETLYLIQNNIFSFTPEEQRRISQPARELTTRLLAAEPTDRPTIQDILHNAWFVQDLNVAADFPHRDGLAAQLASEHLLVQRPATFLDFSTQHAVTAEEEKVLQRAFRKIDTDGYGAITREQIRDMLTTLHGDMVSKEDVSELVRLFTGDAASCEITFAQFREAWVRRDLAHTVFAHSSEFQLANIIGTQLDEVERQVVRQLRAAFNSVDDTHAGVIHLADLQRVFERCHIDVQQDDLNSLMQFFYAHDHSRRAAALLHHQQQQQQQQQQQDRASSSPSNSVGSSAQARGSPLLHNLPHHLSPYNACLTGHHGSPAYLPTPIANSAGALVANSTKSSILFEEEPVPYAKMTISFDAFVMAIVQHELLLRHPMGRKLAAATNLAALFHSTNVTECVRHGFLVVGLQKVVLEKLMSEPERLCLLYTDEVVSTTENIYSFRFFAATTVTQKGAAAGVSMAAGVLMSTTPRSQHALPTFHARSPLRQASSHLFHASLVSPTTSGSAVTLSMQSAQADAVPLPSILVHNNETKCSNDHNKLAVHVPATVSNASPPPLPAANAAAAAAPLPPSSSSSSSSLSLPLSPDTIAGPPPVSEGGEAKHRAAQDAATNTETASATAEATSSLSTTTTQAAAAAAVVLGSDAGKTRPCPARPPPLVSTTTGAAAAPSEKSSPATVAAGESKKAEPHDAVAAKDTTNTNSNISNAVSSSGILVKTSTSADSLASQSPPAVASTSDNSPASGTLAVNGAAAAAHHTQHHTHVNPASLPRTTNNSIASAGSKAATAALVHHATAHSATVSPPTQRLAINTTTTSTREGKTAGSSASGKANGAATTTAAASSSSVHPSAKGSPVQKNDKLKGFTASELSRPSSPTLPLAHGTHKAQRLGFAPGPHHGTTPVVQSCHANTPGPSSPTLNTNNNSNVGFGPSPSATSATVPEKTQAAAGKKKAGGLPGARPTSSSSPQDRQGLASPQPQGANNNNNSSNNTHHAQGTTATATAAAGGTSHDATTAHELKPPLPRPLGRARPLTHRPMPRAMQLRGHANVAGMSAAGAAGVRTAAATTSGGAATHGDATRQRTNEERNGAGGSAGEAAAASIFPHRAMAYGQIGAVSQVNGVCDIDVILAPACLGYTLVRFRRIHGKTNDFHEAVAFISNLLDVERQQAIKDTMARGESELM